MYERLNRTAEATMAYRITGPLSASEVRQITDELEGAIAASGKIRLLLDLQAFPYGELGALWEDLKFDVRFAGKFERLALVGGGQLEKWATRVYALLTLTRCRTFAEEKLDEAWRWLVEDGGGN